MKEYLRTAFALRPFVLTSTVIVLLLVILILISVIQIRPSDIQVPVRFSGYSTSRYHSEQWYYLLNFVVFGVLVAASYIVIGAKLLAVKGKQFALMYLWLGAVVMVIINVMFFALLRVVSVTQ